LIKDLLDLRALTALVAATDEGSFRGAARTLGYTQLAVPHQIAMLERQLFTFDVAWFGALILLPLCFQQVLHASPVLAGPVARPLGVGTALGIGVAGRIRDNHRGTVFGATGLLMVVATTMSLAHLGASTYWVICSILRLAALGVRPRLGPGDRQQLHANWRTTNSCTRRYSWHR
jgi:hypothetical protein